MASTFSLLYLLSLAVAYCVAGRSGCEEEPPLEDIFGQIGKTPVKRYTFTNKYIQVQVMTYGARILVVKVPDSNGEFDDIILGFDNLEGYLGENPYFGAIQGRVGNRIGGANFTLNGKTYYLVPNDNGKHSISGGLKGFDKVIWEPYVHGNKLILSYLSKDGENNFPGTVLTQVTYEINKNQFCFSARAHVTKPTPLNILNHGHYNLAGQDSGPEGIYGHYITINADYYAELDPDQVPTGRLLPVANTIFDLRSPVRIGDVVKEIEGYDHNYCVKIPPKKNKEELHYVGRACHPKSGRCMEVHSCQPGAQCYTGVHLPDKCSKKPICGKGGVKYMKNGAYFIEPQHYPDAVHHPNFPSIIVTPCKPYFCKTCYKFTTLKKPQPVTEKTEDE